MNPLSLALAASALLIAGAASAQTTPPAATPNPAPTPATPAPAAARPTIDSPISALIGDPATKAVVVKHLGELDKHSAYEMFKGMTLRQVAPYSQGVVTDETIAAIDRDLKALPAG